MVANITKIMILQFCNLPDLKYHYVYCIYLVLLFITLQCLYKGSIDKELIIVDHIV